MRPPPAGKNPALSSCTVTRGPILSTRGRNAPARCSKGGAIGLCVPPSRTIVEGASARSSAGSTVWSTRVVLPALPIANVCMPATIAFGTKVTSVESSASPVTSAPPISAAARTAVRCCRSSPGFARRLRIPVTRTAVPVTSASAIEVRRICPPPSPTDPSMLIMPVELQVKENHCRGAPPPQVTTKPPARPKKQATWGQSAHGDPKAVTEIWRRGGLAPRPLHSP
jgi:hypothetical protein